MRKKTISFLLAAFCCGILAFIALVTISAMPREAFCGGTNFFLRSPAFDYGDKIPAQYTCDGEDISPPLEWGNSPAGTGYFTLIVNDPDAPAGNWIHWKVTYIPATFTGLREGIPKEEELPSGIKQGKNTWGTVGYRGPCPPGGSHRYFFTLTAYDGSGQVLGQAILMGKYR